MGKIFDTTPEKLKYLLESIHNREVALPDFQRDFVWDPQATEELIESICQEFPAGSLLRIKNSKRIFFAPREVAGAPTLAEYRPSYLILDGQQRLTSLYQAFYGKGTHKYFIYLGGLIEGMDLEDCVFYEKANRAERRYGNITQQAETLTFPFAFLFGETGGFEEWLDQVLELRSEDGEEEKALKKQLRDIRKQWITPVEDYEFPMVTLAEETSDSAVCTIFETLNRTGVKLSVYDLLAARFWPEDVRLRDLWEQSQNTYPIISDFDIDPYYVLQSVSLFTSKAAPSCKRGDVLKMNVSQIREGWTPIIKGLANSLHILRDDCGVIIPKWLPYNTIVIPMSAIFAYEEGIEGPDVAVVRNKIKKWFWCSVFGQAYENAPNSQAAKDFAELKKWIDGGEQPQTVADFDFDINSLTQITPRQRAVYRGTIALILRNEARDFHTGKRITANMMLEEKIDDHHVFPQGYINDNMTNISATLRDCVLNRTLIDKKTNLHISKRPPSDYLTEIEKAIGEEALRNLLRSHLLPSGKESPLQNDQFEQFIKVRQYAISKKIQEVTE
jgi:hypothetical protein